MSDLYSQAVAGHYSAYRPPLHRLILSRALRDEERFSDGLDVGCGTGRSTIALAKFCRHVVGIDPSQAMLDRATPHQNTSYLRGTSESIPLGDQSIDIVTFAGSLSYADADPTVRELRRVCRSKACIVAYDFEVHFADVLRSLGITVQTAPSQYNHRANLSGVAGFSQVLVEQDSVQFDVDASELAHIVLAGAAGHAAFASRDQTPDPFHRLVADIGLTSQRLTVAADIFYSTYRYVADRAP